MGDFSVSRLEICLAWVFAIPCFSDISFTTVRWVNVIGSQILEKGLIPGDFFLSRPLGLSSEWNKFVQYSERLCEP